MLPDTRSSPILWDLVEESLDEAEFLWALWESALDASNYTLAEVDAWVEDRLLGALAGIGVAASAAIEPLLRPALESPHLARVKVAAYALAKLGDAAALRALEQALRAATPATARTLARGLACAHTPAVLSALWSRVQAVPLACAALTEAFAFDQRAPDTDLRVLLASDEPVLQGAAAAALPFGPTSSLGANLRYALDLPAPEARNRAILSGLCVGAPAAWARCRELLDLPDADSGPLLLAGAILGASEPVQSLLSVCSDAGLCRDGLWALGFAGTRGAAQTCLEWMADNRAPKVAAEAFCAITGLDLRAQGLAIDEVVPEVDEPIAFEAERLDADLTLAADALLPLPDVAGVQRWWAARQAGFDGATRYLGGRPLDMTVLVEALEHAPTRRRHPLALELCVRTRAAFRVQTRDFTRAQRHQLQRLHALAAAPAGLPAAVFERPES